MPTSLFQISTPTALKLSKWALLLLAVVPVACIQCSSTRAPNDYEKMAAYVSNHVDLVDFESGTTTAAAGNLVPQFHFDIENRGPRPIKFAVVQFEYVNGDHVKILSYAKTVFYPGLDQAPAVPLPANATWEMGEGKFVQLDAAAKELEGLDFRASVGYVGFADSEAPAEHE